MVLKTKFISVIAIVLLLVIGTTTVIVIRLQEHRLIEYKLSDASMLNMIVHNSIRDAMRKNDRPAIDKIISDISDIPEVMSLRILNIDGEILISNIKEEVGSKSRGYLTSGYTPAKNESLMGENSITSYHIVRNEPECLACHNKRKDILGIVELKLDILRQRAAVASFKRFLLLSSILAIIFVSVILSLLFNNNIINPLKKLMRTIKDVESGNWNARVSIDENNDIAQIGDSFNKMLSEMNSLYTNHLSKERELTRVRSELESKRRLEELNSQLNFKVKELETANKTVVTLSKEVKDKNESLRRTVDRLKRINDVGRVLTSIIETEEIIKLIIKTSAEILYAKKGTIHIDDSVPHRSLTLSYVKGLGVEKLSTLSIDFRETYSRILASGKATVIELDIPRKKNPDIPIEGRSLSIGVPLKMKGQIIGAMILQDKMDGTPFSNDELDLLSTLSGHAMVAIENAWLYEKLKTNYFSTIQSLVNALEASDKYTKGHSERVRYISVEIGRHIGLAPSELEVLEHAAILHDIGKIGVDSTLLNKEGTLSSEEFKVIKAHPVIGEEILGPIDTLSGVRMTILQHHEHYDGSGYPLGLVGEEISLKARILSVADTFDAMVSHRPYRGPMPVKNALEELNRGAGSQFDPTVVKAFSSIISSNDDSFLTEAGYAFKLSAAS